MKRFASVICGAMAAWLCFAFVQPVLDDFTSLRPFLQRFEYVGVQASTLFLYNPITSESSGHTPTNVAAGSNAYGAWVQMIASTAKPTWEIDWFAGAAVMESRSVQIGTGVAGNELNLALDLGIDDAGIATPNMRGTIQLFIPTSTRIAVRAYGSTTANSHVMLTALER